MTEEILNIELADDPNVPVDDDRNRNIHIAAAHGDQNLVTKEIQRGAKVDIENYLGWTPLMMAVRNGHYNVASLLLQHRADATRKNKFGASVFHISIANGNEELIHLILDFLLKGGVSKLSMESVLSPISLAILFQRSSVLTFLIQKFFNLNISTPGTALTPLMFAAAVNNMAAYKLLKTSGANTTLKNINQQTAQDMLPNNKKERKPSTNSRYNANTNQNKQKSLATAVEPRPKSSSNIISPATFFISPHLSPVTPLAYQQQLFFPPDFSCGQMLSPAMGACYPSPEVYYQIASPAIPQFPGQYAIPVFSPCLNDRIPPYNVSCNSIGVFDEYSVNVPGNRSRM